MMFTITFYKVVDDSTGHPHRVEQGMIDVSKHTREQAIIEAQQRFAQEHHIPRWDFHADGYTVRAGG
jgi:hypothetical protein